MKEIIHHAIRDSQVGQGINKIYYMWGVISPESLTGAWLKVEQSSRVGNIALQEVLVTDTYRGTLKK